MVTNIGTVTIPSGSGSDIPHIQDIEPSNARARLDHATLRFFSLAEQCHTQNFYLSCFKSDFNDIKSKFGLLIEYIENIYIFIHSCENTGDHNEGSHGGFTIFHNVSKFVSFELCSILRSVLNLSFKFDL